MKKTTKLYLSEVLLSLVVVVMVVGANTVFFDGWSNAYSSVTGSSKTTPDKTFLTSSFTKTGAANIYTRDCTVTAGKATTKQKLTSDEQAEVDYFNSAVPKFKVRTIATINGKDMKIFTSKEKTNVDGTTSAKFYIDSKGVYYPSDKIGTWKGFYNKDSIDTIFTLLLAEDVTTYFEKIMKFVKWETVGKTRSAVYSGKLNADGNSDLIGSAFGSSMVDRQDIATVKLYVDEKTQLWSKYETTISKLKSGKVTFPLKGVCKMIYGNAVKINIPTSIEWVDEAIGNEDMINLINSVQ
ncbi:MAG: hypothetical protein WC806_05925 [Candidatus Gracilibacteria bacterium]|jgi:hypothetical protein